MKTSKEPVYNEWRSADEMHNECLKWILELEFITHDHRFIKDLIDRFFSEISSENYFHESHEEVLRLSEHKEKAEKLIKDLKVHNNKLVILIDGLDQLEEERELHKNHLLFEKEVHVLLEDFLKQKAKFFHTLSGIMKEEKHLFLIKKE